MQPHTAVRLLLGDNTARQENACIISRKTGVFSRCVQATEYKYHLALIDHRFPPPPRNGFQGPVPRCPRRVRRSKALRARLVQVPPPRRRQHRRQRQPKIKATFYDHNDKWFYTSPLMDIENRLDGFEIKPDDFDETILLKPLKKGKGELKGWSFF